MSRADLIVSLVKAGSQGDQHLLRTTVEAMAAEERAKHHHQLADKLEENLRAVNERQRTPEVVRSFDGGHGGLLYEVEPRRTLESLFLEVSALEACRELVEEQHRKDVLRSYGLEPRHRVLLSGPPGNGYQYHRSLSHLPACFGATLRGLRGASNPQALSDMTATDADALSL